MSRSKFYDAIKDVIDERGVETPYKNGLTLYFPNTDYTYPFKCDGYMEPVGESPPSPLPSAQGWCLLPTCLGIPSAIASA